MVAAFANLEVEVRAGGPAGGTDFCDRGAFHNGLALADEDCGTVTVKRYTAAAVVDDDIDAVVGVPVIFRLIP